MAPGPPNLQGNRFAILDTVPNKKRKNGIPLETFPNLSVPKSEDPKYITVAAMNPDKPLSSYSCFAVHRSLLAISKEIINISQLRDGRLLLLVRNKNVAKNFTSTKSLPGICDIKVCFHEQLNYVKGTIYAPFLKDVSDEEIVKELSSAGVVEVYKFKKQIEGKEVFTGGILLTFDLYTLPSNIVIAWNKVRVQQFFPTPMRCKSCQFLGHTAKHCKRNPSCVNCGLPPHTPINCTRVFCVNCLDSHSANSKDCPKFQQAREILKIKTINKCSMGEAAKIYKDKIPLNPSNAITFATVLRTNNNNVNIDCPDKVEPTKSVTLQTAKVPVNITNKQNADKQQLDIDIHSKTRNLSNSKLSLEENTLKTTKNDNTNQKNKNKDSLTTTQIKNPDTAESTLSLSQPLHPPTGLIISHDSSSASSSLCNSPQFNRSLHCTLTPSKQTRSKSPSVFTDDSDMST